MSVSTSKVVEDDHYHTDFDIESDFTPRTFSTASSRRSGVSRNSAISQNISSTRNSETEDSDTDMNYYSSRKVKTVSSFSGHARLVPVFITFATVLLFVGIMSFFIFHSIFSSIAPVSERAPSVAHQGRVRSPQFLNKIVATSDGVAAFNNVSHEKEIPVYLHELLQDHDLEETNLDDENISTSRLKNKPVTDPLFEDVPVDIKRELEYESHFNETEGSFEGEGKNENLLGSSECRIPILPLLNVRTDTLRYQPCESSETYGIENSEECCYQVIKSTLSDESGLDLWKTLTCTPFDPRDKELKALISNFEFTRIVCNKFPLHRQGNVMKTELRASISLQSPTVRNKIQYWVDQPPSTRKPINVVIIGLDGISGQLFDQTFVKSRKFLEKIESVSLKGYHVVGQKTLDNIIPLLMGIKKADLPKVCNHHWKTYWDECPYIWKDFSYKKYVTMYSEDIPDTFNFGNQKGFQENPTDFYLRPLLLEKLRFDGNSHCFGNKTATEFILNYGLEFMQKFHSLSTPFFTFMWLNLPRRQRGEDNKILDFVLHKFLRQLSRTANGSLIDNSVFILMSDHGIQSGPTRITMQGFLDHRLPLMFVRFPMKQPSPIYGNVNSALSANRNAIITPFDIHHSLKSILSAPNSSEGTKVVPNRVNIFTDVILNRTCTRAGIDIKWCACNRALTEAAGVNQSYEFTVVQENDLVPLVMTTLNELINVQRESLLIPPSSRAALCPELTFDKLLYIGAHGRVNTTEAANRLDSIIMGIQVQQQMAQFEAFVIQSKNKWEVAPPIIRTDSIVGHNYCIKAKKKIN